MIGNAKDFAELIGKTFGPLCEVIIHDIKTKKISYIVNGHVTGRKIGRKIDDKVLTYLLDKVSKKGMLTGYPSYNSEKKLMKSSTMLIYDEKGEPSALFCINFNIDKLNESLGIINSITQTSFLTDADDDVDSVQNAINIIISQSIQKVKPTSFNTKEGKIRILKELERQGVFKVKDIFPSICEILSISQATLYNYLREMKESNENTSQKVSEEHFIIEK